MVETVQSESFEREMRKRGHEFEQAELVTKAQLAQVIEEALKSRHDCTLICQIDGKEVGSPVLTKLNAAQVYMSFVRLMNSEGTEVRGLQVKDG